MPYSIIFLLSGLRKLKLTSCLSYDVGRLTYNFSFIDFKICTLVATETIVLRFVTQTTTKMWLKILFSFKV